MFDRTENIVGKGENAAYQHFLLFLQCFQRASSSWLLKIQDFLKKGLKMQYNFDDHTMHENAHHPSEWSKPE